jgi:hypothetical protein
MWIKVLVVAVSAVFTFFVGLLYLIHRAFSKFLPMAADKESRQAWLIKNTTKNTKQDS